MTDEVRVTSPSEARVLGLKQYFGKVCRAHPELEGKRRTSTRHCLACDTEAARKRHTANAEKERERLRKWRAANPEKVRERKREWRAANAEKERERRAKWRAANPEKVRESLRKWRAANAEKLREHTRKWQRANSHIVLANAAKRRAAECNAAVPLTTEEQSRVKAKYAEARRLTKETGKPYHVAHDRPLAPPWYGKHHPDNLVVVPASTSLARGARYASLLDFMFS